jgi:hypothetical protein
MGVKAVLVRANLATKLVVAQSPLQEHTAGNQSSLPVEVSWTYNCGDIWNIGYTVLGYGWHKALPAYNDPTPDGGRTVIYTDALGKYYTWQPW